MIRVSESASTLVPSAEMAAGQAQFRERHHVKLPGFLETAFLRKVQSELRTVSFEMRTHEGIGRELTCWGTPAGDALLFVLNDPRLFEAITQLTGIGPIGCFIGRIYRMTSDGESHDSWHSDMGDHRLVGLSINLSEEPYRGGALVLREQGRPETEQVVENTVPGDALLFRIDPALEHRVADIEPGPPKTAYAGWFRSRPSFKDVLAGKVPF